MKAIARYGYLLMCLAALVLAVTGIGVFITGKAPMTRWGLMVHMAAAPAFAMGLAAVSLTWAGRMGRNAVAMLFWLFLLSGLAVILTGVLPMLPVFGADGQHFLYLTHRYSALVCAGALLLFSGLWFAGAARAERR